jgi:hypothetical protein
MECKRKSVNSFTSTANSYTYAGNVTSPPLQAGDTIFCEAKSTNGFYDLDQSPIASLIPLTLLITLQQLQVLIKLLMKYF